MKTISIDFQPQRSFLGLSKKAATVYLGEMVAEMNKNALFADKRILIQSQPDTILAKWEEQQRYRPFRATGFVRLINAMVDCELLPGLPSESRYDRIFSVNCREGADQSLCFHDEEGKLSTGLTEWLLDQEASTLIVGGTAIDRSLMKTVKQLHFSGNWDIVVNLAACRGFEAESTLAAINELRGMGIRTISNSMELVSKLMPVRQNSAEFAKINHVLKFAHI